MKQATLDGRAVVTDDIKVTFEPTEGVMRALNPNGSLMWSCPVTLTPDGTAWFRGLKGIMSHRIATAVNKRLVKLHMQFAAWFRWNPKTKVFELQRHAVRGGTGDPFGYLKDDES